MLMYVLTRFSAGKTLKKYVFLKSQNPAKFVIKSVDLKFHIKLYLFKFTINYELIVANVLLVEYLEL
jgi:hypothetical protein